VTIEKTTAGMAGQRFTPASWIVLAIGTLLTVAAALRSRTLATPTASGSVGAI
jgi:hypothetical protein